MPLCQRGEYSVATGNNLSIHLNAHVRRSVQLDRSLIRSSQMRQMTHTPDMLFILASTAWPKPWILFHYPLTTPSASSRVIYVIARGSSLGRHTTLIMIQVHHRLQSPSLTTLPQNVQIRAQPPKLSLRIALEALHRVIAFLTASTVCACG